jgi:hypothetical protein
MELVTRSELAAELHISRPRFSVLVDRGLPVRADGKIDLERACRWIIDTLDDGGRARIHAREYLHICELRTVGRLVLKIKPGAPTGRKSVG